MSRPRVAVAVVVFRDNKLLFVKRKNPPAQGTWALPGGSVECGETLAEAAKREVMEETGLDVRVGRVLTAVDAIYVSNENVSEKAAFDRKDISFHYVIVYLEAFYLSGVLVAADDAEEAQWISRKELRGLLCEPAVKRLCESFYN